MSARKILQIAAGFNARDKLIHACAGDYRITVLMPAAAYFGAGRSLTTSPAIFSAQAQAASTSGPNSESDRSSASPSASGTSGSENKKNDAGAGPGPNAGGNNDKEKGTRNEGKDKSGGSMLRSLAREVQETLMPLGNIPSYTRRYKGPVAEPSTGVYDGSSALAIVKRTETPWQKAWSSVHEKLAAIPFLSKVMGFKVADTTAYQKGQQLVEDLKEKYETSDHPVVHKVEEYKERMFAGSEASRAMQEIRIRDPSFDMNIFLRSIKLDTPIVTEAFLKHDMESLRDHCGPEIMQRLEGLCAAYQQQELKEDPTILFVGDVEVVEVRMMETDPFIICQFHCQQLKCVRDKFGNVVEGSPDTIQRVYYFWGLQQEKQGVVTADGVLLPPRWVIKDMLWQSMLALI